MRLIKCADLLLNDHRLAHVTFHDKFLTLLVYNEYNELFLIRRAQPEIWMAWYNKVEVNAVLKNH